MADLSDLLYHFRGEYSINTAPTVDYKKPDVKPVEIIVDDRAATREAIIYSIRKQGYNFVPRSNWKALKNNPNDMHYDWDYTMVAIHHAGRSYFCTNGLLQMQEIQKEHMQGINKFGDVGYHFGIDCAGTILEGRDIRYQGEHLSLYNSKVIGIVLLANLIEQSEGNDMYSKVRRTAGMPANTVVPDEQIKSVEALVKILQQFFKIQKLGGHREFPNNHKRDCPGNIGLSIVKNLRKSTGLIVPS